MIHTLIADRPELLEKLKRIRVIASDLDHTLVPDSALLGEKTIQTFHEAKEQGFAVMLCSGRTDLHMRHYAEKLGVTSPLIGCNGAVIRDPKQSTPLYQSPLDIEAARDALAQIRKAKIDYLIYTPDAVYYPEDSQRIERFFQYNDMASAHSQERISLIVHRADMDLPAGSFKIFTKLSDATQARHLEELINLSPKLSCVESMDGVYDIMNHGISKGSGLIEALQRSGCSPSELLYFGDHHNDLSAMRVAAVSAAVANAKEEVKAASDIVVPSCDDEGPAQLIQALIALKQTQI